MNITMLRNELWRYNQTQALVENEVQAQVQRSLAVKEHIRRLEEEDLEDRIRIQRLLALSQPVRRDVTLVMDEGQAGRGGRMQGRRRQQGQDEGEGEEKDEEQGGGGEEQRKKEQTAWVEKALKKAEKEKDAEAIETLLRIQRLNQVYTHHTCIGDGLGFYSPTIDLVFFTQIFLMTYTGDRTSQTEVRTRRRRPSRRTQ